MTLAVFVLWSQNQAAEPVDDTLRVGLTLLSHKSSHITSKQYTKMFLKTSEERNMQCGNIISIDI